MFDKELFEKHLATSWLGRSFYFFEELPSTNSYAKKIKDMGSLHGAVVLTDHQTGGRGQYDRKWHTSAGENLTFSLIFEPQKAERFSLLTLACALSITEVINEMCGIPAVLKWPNDILHDGKKLSGILTETLFLGNHLERVVVGIGLNVYQTEFEGNLSDQASSLKLEAKADCPREELLANILQKIEYRYRLWNQHNAKLVKEINKVMIGFGEWKSLKVNGENLQGKYKFLGVNEAGELLALNKDLDLKTFAYEQVRVV
ncbi:biotin--[acetyl-CoA-carboxylase] ligase [Gracilimonas halophila]|uniref:Biotin--[acetyl-CoA-carboxylase] ligase n=1 Tax=Gracilimonas halophila TaxID=1834464 RepID=A0ABW5JEJ6_9BACT